MHNLHSCFYCCCLCLAVVFVFLYIALDLCRDFTISLHNGCCCFHHRWFWFISILIKIFQVGSLKNNTVMTILMFCVCVCVCVCACARKCACVRVYAFYLCPCVLGVMWCTNYCKFVCVLSLI